MFNKKLLIESLLKEDIKVYKALMSLFSKIKSTPKDIDNFDKNKFKISFKSFSDFIKNNEIKQQISPKQYVIVDLSSQQKKVEKYKTLAEYGKSILEHLNNNNILSLASCSILYKAEVFKGKQEWVIEAITLDDITHPTQKYFDPSDIIDDLKNKINVLKDKEFYVNKIVLVSKKSFAKEKEDEKDQESIWNEILTTLKGWDSNAWASDDNKRYLIQKDKEDKIREYYKKLHPSKQSRLKELMKKYKFNL